MMLTVDTDSLLFLLFSFFNPLHAKPNGEGVAPNETLSPKGILYDIEGKFAYSTYNEEMRSYHPMLDIKALTKDLKWKKKKKKTPRIPKKKGNETACVVDLEWVLLYRVILLLEFI